MARMMVFWGLLLWGNWAVAQTVPELIVSPDGHQGAIRAVLFADDGQQLITGGEDGTIRVWETLTGELRRTYRPVAPQNEGEIFALALTADGRYLAFAGAGSQGIRVLDLLTGQLVAQLSGHTNSIAALAFSPSQDWLASASTDRTVRLWSWPGALHGQGPTHQLDGHTAAVYDLAWSPDGRKLASAGFDQTIRLWEMANEPSQKPDAQTLTGHRGEVNTVDFAPNGVFLASGGSDQRMYLWQAKNGQRVAAMQPSGSPLLHLRLLQGGEHCFVGFAAQPFARVIKTASQAVVAELPEVQSPVLAQAVLPGRQWLALATEQGQILVYDRANRLVRQWQAKPKAYQYLGFTGEQRLAFGVNGPERGFDFGALAFDFGQNLSREAVLPTDQRDLPSELEDSYRLPAGAFTVENDPGADGAITAYTWAGDFLVVGSQFSLKVYDQGGQLMRQAVAHRGQITALVSRGKTWASAAADGSIRLWQADDTARYPSAWETLPEAWQLFFTQNQLEATAKGQSAADWQKLIRQLQTLGEAEKAAQLEQYLSAQVPEQQPVASLFVSPDDEWVCWLANGYYAASAGGERLIGWQSHRPPQLLADFYPASAFRSQYLKPNQVREAVYQGRAMVSRPLSAEQLTEAPPRIEWVTPVRMVDTTDLATFLVKARIHSQTPITRSRLLLDGRAVATERGFIQIKGDAPYVKEISYEITFEKGLEEYGLRVYAANEIAKVTSEERIIRWIPKKEIPKDDFLAIDMEEALFKPNLYMLSIGISAFQNSTYNLNFADDDAKSMAELFKSQKGKLYKEVTVKELTDDQATRANIIDAFYWLEKQATQKDVVVIFIAAHGFNERGKFYLLPHDGDHERLMASGVAWEDFAQVLGNLPSRVLLFLDACHSGSLGSNLYAARGAVDNTEALRELSTNETGVVIMSASTGNESSLESEIWGHGAFTKALLSGMENGQADMKPDGIIYLRELDYFVADEVKKLTEGRQHSTTQKPSSISRFPIFQLER